MEVFTMALNANHESVLATSAMIISEEVSAAFPVGKKVLFGSGAAKCKSILTGKEFIYNDEIQFPSAKNMVSLVAKKYANKQFEDLAYFEPFYLKDFYTNAPKVN
jgi:tRNA threonylcarbamoyladenosine biosynthesis protein TsaB